MSSVAVHGVDVEVRAVGLWREAVIVNVDPNTLNVDRRGVHRVHEVSVLGDHAAVVRERGGNHVGVADILGRDDEVVPAGRVLEVNARHVQVGGVLSIEQNRAVVFVVRVEDGAYAVLKLVPPTLAFYTVSCLRQHLRQTLTYP